VQSSMYGRQQCDEHGDQHRSTPNTADPLLTLMDKYALSLS